MSAVLSLFIFIHFHSCYTEHDALNLSFTIGSAASHYYAQREMAVGYDVTSDDILLFGGYYHTELFLLFKNHHFFSAGSDFLNYSVRGLGQYYSQFEDELYMMRPNGEGFLRFNTETHESVTLYVTTPTNVSHGACLTSITDHLIIIGGTTYARVDADAGHERTPTTDGTSVQIYRLSDGEWLSNVPSLGRGRKDLACAAVDDKIYAIGGEDIEDRYSQIDTIEVLDVSEMDSISAKSWYIFRATLSTPRGKLRATVHGRYIYVVGGYYSGEYLRDINRINTATEECIVVGYLAVGLCLTSPIIVGNVLFVFGGETNNHEWYESDKFYQYAALSTRHHSGTPHSADAQQALGKQTIMVIIIIASATVCIILMLFFYFGKREFEKAARDVTWVDAEVTPGGAPKTDASTPGDALEVCGDKQVINRATAGSHPNIQEDEFIVRSDSNSEHSPHGTAPVLDRAGTNVQSEGEGQNVDANTYVINADTAMDLKEWLTSIGCVIYYDSFVNNGFDSLELIKEINSVNDLRSIGISMKAQQLKIMNHIKQLK
eukprot:69113_1